MPRFMKTALLLLCAASFAAQAQYVWVDEKGHKQYSDTPPPPTVPQKKILRGQKQGDAPPDSAPASNAASQDSAPPPSLQSKNEEFNKRRAEQVEKDQKAADAKRQADEKKKNCDRIRSYQRTLTSGARVVTTDANGERNYMSDDQRQKEIGDTNKALQDCH